MALPTTGQLSLNDINVELGNSSGSQASLRSMSSTAGFTIPDQVSDFYGYSGGSTIVYDYTTPITVNQDTVAIQDYDRPLAFTGRVSGDVITLPIDIIFTITTPGLKGTNARVYKIVNGTETLLGSWTSAIITSVNVTGVDFNDNIGIRLFLSGLGSTSSLASTLQNGSFTSGSGTVTASGTTGWTISLP